MWRARRRFCSQALIVFALVPLAAGQLLGGQFFTAGLIIVDSPQPGSTVEIGQKLQVAMDVSADGLIPTPNANVATSLLNLKIFLVSAPNSVNFSVSEGTDLGGTSTVARAEVDLPDCLPGGDYNLTFYELSQINSKAFFTIDSIPLTLARSSSLSQDPSSSCESSTSPETQPQADSRSPVQPIIGNGEAAFVLSTNALVSSLESTAISTSAGTTTISTTEGETTTITSTSLTQDFTTTAFQTTRSSSSTVASSTSSTSFSTSTPSSSSRSTAATRPKETGTSTASSSGASAGSTSTLPFGATSPPPTSTATGLLTTTTIVTAISFSPSVTLVTTGAFPTISTSQIPVILTTSFVVVFPTDAQGSPAGPTSTMGSQAAFGVFGASLVSGGGRVGLEGALSMLLAVAFASLSIHYSESSKNLQSTHPPGKFDGRPGLLNLDGGVPATAYFPIESISVEYLRHDAFSLSPEDAEPSRQGMLGWLASIFSPNFKTFTIPRNLGDASASDKVAFELKTALTYSPVQGLKPLESWIHEWSGKAHKPAISDWETLVTIGATASWSVIVKAFLNPGEGFLADAYAYNFAISQAGSLNAHAASVGLDSDGTSAEDLERVLSTWDEKARGFPRPRLLYTQGGISNPTGQIITLERKKQIYEICVKYDIIIAEDDPYRWQEYSSPYVLPASVREREALSTAAVAKTDEKWLEGTTPSFLNVDYQGRVIRIDTFSKTVGPGSRLGYFTTSPSLRRVLQYINETTTQAPSGLSQAIVGQLLHEFKTDGFVRWLRGIAAQYELRRNWSLDTLAKHLHLEEASDSPSIIAFDRNHHSFSDAEKKSWGKSLFSFVPPAGGMFIWLAIHLQNHPSYKQLSRDDSPAKAKTFLADKLWNDLGENGVLFRPGELFAVPTPEERANFGEDVIYLRAAYSFNKREELEAAFKIFAETVVTFFK
ncbi:hypothetical protein P7C70_g3836, partial [Phenoliferia sp. Uapishka_3]